MGIFNISKTLILSFLYCLQSVWLRKRKMQILISFLLFMRFASSSSVFDETFASGLEEWKTWKTEHTKTYGSTEEEQRRYRIYHENKEKVERHNRAALKGEKTFYMKLNHFSDMTSEEFTRVLNDLKFEPSSHHNKTLTFNPPTHLQMPARIDWRELGAVTPVKNQGFYCGSCWAFSATGALEGQHFRQTGKLVSLSEQQLLECAREKYDLGGCDGGYPFQAFKYVRDNHGLDTEESYPYEENDYDYEDNLPCRYDISKKGATDQGYQTIEKGNDEALKSAVATVGPISIVIAVDGEDWQHYSHGVYTSQNCPLYPNHGVLLVGYDQDVALTKDPNSKKVDTWIVKNSWGEKWGDKGYIHLTRNVSNYCLISDYATYPIVKSYFH